MPKAKRIRKHISIPENLLRQIQQIAKSEMRSFNSQCLVFLMQGVEEVKPGWNDDKRTIKADS